MREVNTHNKMLPKVSIIILNWNTTLITCDLLLSLKKHLTYSNVEIIIVDNGSAKDPSSDFKSIFSDLKIILNAENYGFSAGCNIGMKQASGDYFLFLNSDTEITSGIIEKLLEAFSIDHNAGIVSPLVFSYFNKTQIEYAGYNQLHPITGRARAITSSISKLSWSNSLAETHYAYGAAMMISRKIYEEVGGLHEAYFAYYEELDWSNRIREKGYKIYCNKEAIVYHKGSMSTSSDTPFKTFLLTRNRLLYMKRNSFGIQYHLFLSYYLLVAAPKNLISYLFSLEFKHCLAYLNALLFHLSGRTQYFFKTTDEKLVLIKSS